LRHRDEDARRRKRAAAASVAEEHDVAVGEGAASVSMSDEDESSILADHVDDEQQLAGGVEMEIVGNADAIAAITALQSFDEASESTHASHLMQPIVPNSRLMKLQYITRLIAIRMKSRASATMMSAIVQLHNDAIPGYALPTRWEDVVESLNRYMLPLQRVDVCKHDCIAYMGMLELATL